MVSWFRGAGHAAGMAAVLSGLCGCPNTDAAVFVKPTIVDPTASLEQSSLATGLGGGFTLKLHLGPRAADSSTVTLEQLSVLNADRTATVVQTLAVSTDPAFPVTVNVDSEELVAVQFAATDNLLAPAAQAELCAGGGIVVSGVIHDSLLGATTPVVSVPFAPSGCP